MVDVSQGGFGSLAAQEAESTAPWAQMQTPNTFQGKDGTALPAESTLEIDNPSAEDAIQEDVDTGSESAPEVSSDYDFFSFVDEDDDDLRKKVKSSSGTPSEDSGKFKVGIKVDDAKNELDSMLADDKITKGQYKVVAEKLKVFSDEVPDKTWDKLKKNILATKRKTADDYERDIGSFIRKLFGQDDDKIKADDSATAEQNKPVGPTKGDIARSMLGDEYDAISKIINNPGNRFSYNSERVEDAKNKLTEMTGLDYSNISEKMPALMIDRAAFDIGDDQQHLDYLANLQAVVFDAISKNFNMANDTSLSMDEREKAISNVSELNKIYNNILQSKKENSVFKEKENQSKAMFDELYDKRFFIEGKAKLLGLDYENMSEEEKQKLERADAYANEFGASRHKINPETEEGRKWFASWQKLIDTTPYLSELFDFYNYSTNVGPKDLSAEEEKYANDEAAFRASIPLSEFAKRNPDDITDIVDDYRQKYNVESDAESNSESEKNNNIIDFLNKLLKNRVNLSNLLDSIKDLSDDELLAQGYTPDAIRLMRDAAAERGRGIEDEERVDAKIYDPNVANANGGMNLQASGKNEDFNAGQEKQETSDADVTSDENMKNIRTLYRNQPHIRKMWKNLNDKKSSKK